MKKTVAAIAACMVACAAQAGGFYVGGQLGVMSFKNFTDDDAQGISGPHSTSQDTQLAVGRLFTGYNINPLVGIELGYLQMADAKGSLSGTTAGGSKYGFDYTYRNSGFDLSAVVHPFESSRNGNQAPSGLFLRAGVSQYTTSVNWVSGSYTGSDSKTGTGTMLGLGYDWKLGPGALRLDATLHQSMADITNNDSLALSAGYVYPF